MRRCNPLAFALLAIAGAASSAPASAQITLDGSVGPSGSLIGPNYSIPATVGRQLGGNLFHSFGRFNVNTGESATFSGPSSVTNVIGRVTAGLPSGIDGLLRSTIAGANLFLINPAGIFFGPNASLDVTGSFHASSAHYLALGANGRYDAINPQATVLTSAAPSAFGFVAANPASVQLDGTALNAFPGTSLTFVGGNVTLAGAQLITSAGNLNLASIASPGEVALINSETVPQPGTAGGSIAITGSFLGAQSAFGVPVGKIVIRGGTLALVDSTVVSVNSVAAPASDVLIQANDFSMDRAVILTTTDGTGSSAGVDVQARRVALAGGSQVTAGTLATGASGNISIIAADSFRMSGTSANGRRTNVTSASSSSGRAGDIRITAPVIELDGAQILTNALDQGAAGNITIQGDSIALTGARLSSSTFAEGAAGNIAIQGGRIALTGGAVISSDTLAEGVAGNVSVFGSDSVVISSEGDRVSGLTSTTSGSGRGGDVLVTAPLLTMDGSTLRTDATGSGAAGNIAIRVGDLGMNFATIVSGATGAGAGGNVAIQANRIVLTGPSQINSSSAMSAAGSLSVTASESVSFVRGTLDASFDGFESGLFSIASGDGRGGDVLLAAPTIGMSEFVIRAQARASGAAGNITVQANRLTLTNGSQIDSTSFAQGAAGAIAVNVSDSVEISGRAASGLPSGLFSISAGSGRGGNIVVRGPVFTLSDALISADAFGSASPGSVVIAADRVALSRGGQITSSSRAPAPGSVVSVTASESVDISGTNGDGVRSALFGITFGSGSGSDVIVTTPLLTMNGGGISTRTTDRGPAGNITIQADRVALTGGSQFNLGSTASGTAGTLRVTAADSINISGRGADGSPSGFFSRTEGSGAGGDIVLTAPVVAIDDAAVRADTSGSGVGGNIVISANRLVIANGGQLDSSASGAGAGGTVSLTASESIAIAGANPDQPSNVLAASLGPGRGGEITMTAPQITIDGGALSGSALDTGAAGSINLRGNTISLAHGGLISAKTSGSGPGGAISVVASESLTLTDGSSISASSTGTGNAGNIDINAGDALRLSGSSIRTEASTADGGNIHIQAATLVHLRHSRITTSVGTGFGNGGNINIDPDFVVLDASQIIANAFGGNGGNINIITDALLQSGDSVISASSQLGIPGTIRISAPESDLTGGLTPLAGGLFDSSLLLRESCSARAGRAGNSFVGVGHGGLPDRPGSFAYSSYAQLPLGAAAGRAPIFALLGGFGSSCSQ